MIILPDYAMDCETVIGIELSQCDCEVGRCPHRNLVTTELPLITLDQLQGVVIKSYRKKFRNRITNKDFLSYEDEKGMPKILGYKNVRIHNALGEIEVNIGSHMEKWITPGDCPFTFIPDGILNPFHEFQIDFAAGKIGSSFSQGETDFSASGKIEHSVSQGETDLNEQTADLSYEIVFPVEYDDLVALIRANFTWIASSLSNNSHLVVASGMCSICAPPDLISFGCPLFDHPMKSHSNKKTIKLSYPVKRNEVRSDNCAQIKVYGSCRKRICQNIPFKHTSDNQETYEEINSLIWSPNLIDDSWPSSTNVITEKLPEIQCWMDEHYPGAKYTIQEQCFYKYQKSDKQQIKKAKNKIVDLVGKYNRLCFG